MNPICVPVQTGEGNWVSISIPSEVWPWNCPGVWIRREGETLILQAAKEDEQDANGWPVWYFNMPSVGEGFEIPPRQGAEAREGRIARLFGGEEDRVP